RRRLFPVRRRKSKKRLPCTGGVLILNERVDEVFRVEWDEVVDLLAYADVEDGKFEFHGYGYDHAALCRAVELGEDDAVEVDGFREYLRLGDSVLSRGRVEHEIFAE